MTEGKWICLRLQDGGSVSYQDELSCMDAAGNLFRQLVVNIHLSWCFGIFKKTIPSHTHLSCISSNRLFSLFSMHVLLTTCIIADANTSTIAFDSVVFLREALFMFGNEVRPINFGDKPSFYSQNSPVLSSVLCIYVVKIIKYCRLVH